MRTVYSLGLSVTIVGFLAGSALRGEIRQAFMPGVSESETRHQPRPIIKPSWTPQIARLPAIGTTTDGLLLPEGVRRLKPVRTRSVAEAGFWLPAEVEKQHNARGRDADRPWTTAQLTKEPWQLSQMPRTSADNSRNTLAQETSAHASAVQRASHFAANTRAHGDRPVVNVAEPLPPRFWETGSQHGPTERPLVIPPRRYRVLSEFKWKDTTFLFVDVDSDNVVDMYRIHPKRGPEFWYDINEFSGHPMIIRR